MGAKLVGLTMMVAVAVGCAHGPAGLGAAGGRDVRGAIHVGQQARALVVGPAHLVHATGEKPVRWFVADRVSGDDTDCARASAGAVLTESTTAHLTVTPGHVLCAAVGDGSTDIAWHQLAERNDNMWALR